MIDTGDRDYMFKVYKPNESNLSSKIRKIMKKHNITSIDSLDKIDAVQVIHPYFDDIMQSWVFDDKDKGLEKEALIEGIDLLLDRASPDRKPLSVAFSNKSFGRCYDHILDFVTGDRIKGCIYMDRTTGLNGWLCPSLFKYFDEAPKTIYIKILEM